MGATLSRAGLHAWRHLPAFDERSQPRADYSDGMSGVRTATPHPHCHCCLSRVEVERCSAQLRPHRSHTSHCASRRRSGCSLSLSAGCALRCVPHWLRCGQLRCPFRWRPRWRFRWGREVRVESEISTIRIKSQTFFMVQKLHRSPICYSAQPQPERHLNRHPSMQSL